jgi:intracellular sulfur oxidation DsrE/DsrF family protein
MLKKNAVALVLVSGTLITGWAFEEPESKPVATAGPVIEDFGEVYDIPSPGFSTPVEQDYRVVFDVAISPENESDLNPRINTLARFLNMHVRAGVPKDKLHIALVLHGQAGKDALRDEPYRSRFKTANPNAKLIAELVKNGVEVYLCGQSATYRGLNREELMPGVKVALSAMTVLVSLQQRGYSLIAF